MTDEPRVKLISASESPVVDIVFVHGLTGDAEATWSDGNSDDSWLAWLAADVERIRVYSLGYPASVIQKPFNKEMDLFERSVNVLEKLVSLGIGERPIVFIAHSLGGILVKMILRKSDELNRQDWGKVAISTQLVVFLATPHLGSELAKLTKVIPYTSKHIDLLANKTGFLSDLNQHYRTLANNRDDLDTVASYEKHTINRVLVVSQESADPGVAGPPPIAVDKNHIDICKPADREDLVYAGVKIRVQKLVALTEGGDHVLGSHTLANDYEENSLDDRRNLHQKLLDAGREHEYRVANNAQNGFARRYAKLGLYTAARERHNILLAEVRTRFLLHVYHPLICKSAPVEAIQTALQDQVIDPLTVKSIGGTRFDATSVLNALYFLTEKCYVQWDIPNE